MHTVLIDVSALDAEAWRQAVAAGALARLGRALRAHRICARQPGDAQAQAAWLSPAECWMRHALGLDEPEMHAPEQQAPWGALAAAAAGLPVDGHAWALAWPAHLLLGRDSLRLHDPAQLRLDADDAQQLLDAVRPLLHEQQWRIHVLHPGRWLLGHDSLRDVRTADPSRAIGHNAASWMPGGDAAAPWRRLLTEMQMVWMQHPVNERRNRQGLPEVNAVWLHGCGVLPMRPANPFVLDPAQAQQWAQGSCAWLAALGEALAAMPASRHPHPLHVLRPQLRDGQTADAACAELDEQAHGLLRGALGEHSAVRVVLAGARGWADVELRRPRAWQWWGDAAARELLGSL
jgi:hypothetical protein